MTESNSSQAHRDGCLTTWLVLMILAGAARAISVPFSYDAIKQSAPTAAPVVVVILPLLGVATIVFALALFRWKKWGFYGFAIAKLITLAIHLAIGYNVIEAIFGLVGIGILYWVLNIGGDHKAWPQLQ